MYLDHFKLSESPFQPTPDPALLFWTDDHARAFNLLTQAACSDRRVTWIEGEPGIGKTALLRCLVARLPKNVRVGMISDHASGSGGLGQWLNRAFDLDAAGTESECRASFEAYLVAQHHEGVCCLLIVDDVQNLSDDDVAALIGLTRLPAVAAVSLRLVLAGQPKLRGHLPAPHDRKETDASPAVRIGPMSLEDVGGYIRHHMAMAGSLDPVFDEAAIERIARFTGGVPRLVNGLGKLLLRSACEAGKTRIDAAFVNVAVQDARRRGVLNRLLHRPDQPGSGAPTPTRDRAPLPSPPPRRTPNPVRPTPPWARNSGPFPLRTSVAAPTRPAPANVPAQPDSTATPIKAGKSRKRRPGLFVIAASTAAAAVAFAAIFAQLDAPAPTAASLQQDRAPPAQAATADVSTPVPVGPVLAAPAGLQETEAGALYEQALIVGAEDPLAAAIGFARAALRGDDRSAFYLGQHFEAGDGVPRNAALAAAWYSSASKTGRGARRALENLAETLEATGQLPTAPPRPLMGVEGADGQGEFVWAAPDAAAARYLVELTEAPDAQPRQYGPFDLSAALLEPAAPARLWRVVSLGPDDTRVGASDWHLIGTDGSASAGAAP